MTTMVQHAVIEHNGKWPAPTNSDGFRYGQLGVMIWRSEFEACAKSLGYINGYRWGIEYPTNGKRPDLGSIIIRPFFAGAWRKEQPADSLDWRFDSEECDPVTKFIITEPRYKPVDEVSEISESKRDEVSEAISAFCKLPNSLQDLYQESFDKWVEKRTAEIKSSTEREKVIEAANKIYYASVDVDDFIENLVKAEMLVLPPKKSDTKD